ncbi:MAG: hypothetical protein R6V06_03235 [Kiritimatiellia bacterium]
MNTSKKRPRPTDTYHRRHLSPQSTRRLPDSRHSKPRRRDTPSYYKPYHPARASSRHYYHPAHRRADRRFHRSRSRPLWWGPFSYPASYGFTWRGGGIFSVSFVSHSPFYYNYHTPYYNSWYYSGWRHGWYGGLSYVCNPWPVYRTCYFYDADPVIIEKPVLITEENELAPAESTTTEIQTAPADGTSGYPDNYVVVEERTTIRSASARETEQHSANAGFDPDYIYEDQFDPFYYNGVIPDEEFRIAFSSYASTLNPESIWISYAGLNRIY